MSSFNFLSHNQTIFSNSDALDTDFIPKILPHREDQQRSIAESIAPLLKNRSGPSLILQGPAGVGKSVSAKRVLMDLEELDDAIDISKVYVNCWKANTTYKVMTEIAHQIGFKFTHNLKTNEIINKIIEKLDKRKGVVIILDEADKADDYDFLYHILENLTRKTLILITNDESWSKKIDFRIASRLTPEIVNYSEYTSNQIFDILKERIKYAFYQNVWSEDLIEQVAITSSKFKDIRIAIKLVKQIGEVAENESSKKIEINHLNKAISKIPDFKIKSSKDFNETENFVKKICEEHSGKTTGELFSIYSKRGGKKSEKTFKRVLDTLEKKRIITQRMTSEGFRGRSSIIKYNSIEKKITDY